MDGRLLPKPRRDPGVVHPSAWAAPGARLALARDPAAAAAQVMALREAGMVAEVLLHELIAPAARRLGALWEADSADFIAVALAGSRLTAIVRSLGARAGLDVGASAPRALVATLSGERHALGALIVAQSLRRAGWRVREMPGTDTAELVAAVTTERVAMLGISAGSRRGLAGLADCVRSVRAASANPDLVVSLGGHAFVEAPWLGAEADADHVALDGRDAVAMAQSRLSRSGKPWKSRGTPAANP